MALFVLLRRRSVEEVIAALAWACAVVVTVAVLSGVSSLADGRLRGGVPPLSPNEVALLAGIALVHVAWRVLQHPVAAWEYGLACWWLVLVWLSGSRTGLLMLVLGLLAMLLLTRRFRPSLVVGALVTVAAGSVLLINTGALVGFAERDGTGTDTLDSRFNAWRAAVVWAESVWRGAFGGGLSLKVIPVVDRFRDTQPLDSSWVSALVQAGVVGLLVALVWMLWMVRNVIASLRSDRVLHIGLTVFLVGRSTVESGLFDATPAFLVVLVVSLAVEGGTWERPQSASARAGWTGGRAVGQRGPNRSVHRPHRGARA
ncbi:O-antigen ligase family protein [Geodermatophilus sp. Leaf369]|uniref:O-antigen ligase family protein n=1 Tax=Geodermatophilus sp. Leaf369 TaxID=1736354 RepID=UPI0012FC6A7E|nr:O-antigen ligase family protein [Geodermatophilus sp. Leaf369]